MSLKAIILLISPVLMVAQVQNFLWPLAPMNQQHRISATFDECREDRDHFHNGTDMPLAPGGEVLSIMAGQVTGIGSDWIRVEDFAYVHVNANPALHVGNTVAQGAVVGWTDSYAHIHLNYGGGASGHPTGNPLLPNRITPFNDPYHPRSPIIRFAMDGTDHEFPGVNLSGRIDIIAQAADTTDLESTIDMNNGIYKIGYALYDADTSQILEGPYFRFEANELYSNNYINNVYAPGSSTSIYRYKVTNRVYSNGYIDCDNYDPGSYVVCVMSADTRDNWDTTFVRVNFSDIDLLPPGQPDFTFIGANEAGDLEFTWEAPSDADLGGYVLEFSFNGSSWSSNHGPEILTPDLTSYVVSGFPQNSYIQFRLKALDQAPIPNESEYSDTYGIRLNAGNDQVLIVDGFDRTDGSWSLSQHNFATYYSDALVDGDHDVGISVASNEWLTTGGALDGYDKVIWFLGDESTAGTTFSDAEQALLESYLAGGGNLFLSGAEIGYDLQGGTTQDQRFLSEVLHLQYAGDDAANTQVNGVGVFFSGVSFGYGSAPYEEDWPDHFAPLNGGEVVLKYGNDLNAGIGFRSPSAGNCLTIGFAFETIDTDNDRRALVDAIFSYFDTPVSIEDGAIPLTYSVSAVYPNPFNHRTNLRFSLDQPGTVDFHVYDIMGRLVFAHAEGPAQTGVHHWSWDGRTGHGKLLPSGTYLLTVSLPGHAPQTQKLILLK